MRNEAVSNMSVVEASRLAGEVLDEVERAVVGKREALTLVLAAILAKGHVLLEDFPGLGKTLAARSFARALGLDFTRAQFTPDLLPADLTGSFLYDQRRGEFDFRRGPIFTGLLRDSLGEPAPLWAAEPVQPVVPEGADARLAAYVRLVEDHLTSRTPDGALRDRLVTLSGQRLAEELGGPPRRLSPAQIDDYLRRIEEL